MDCPIVLTRVHLDIRQALTLSFAVCSHKGTISYKLALYTHVTLTLRSSCLSTNQYALSLHSGPVLLASTLSFAGAASAECLRRLVSLVSQWV